MKSKKGYTLAEILIVISLLGVLATLSMPRYTIMFERTRASEGQQILIALMNAQKAVQLETGSFATTLIPLAISFPTPVNFDDIDDDSITAPVAVTDPVSNVQRNTGTYELLIDQNGLITCDDSQAGMTAGSCININCGFGASSNECN